LASKYKLTKPLSKKIGQILVATGILLFVLAYFLTSQILVFMGLGSTFWGALFLLITPILYVEGTLMSNTFTSAYTTTERIIKDLNYKGKGFHIPPYPEKTVIPEHLKGLREMVVFIPKDAEMTQPPSLQELVEGKFLLKNPEGIVLTPPGLGLLGCVEKRSQVSFSNTEIGEVGKIMATHILGGFSLAKEIKVTVKDNEVNLKIKGSIYKDFYTENGSAISVSLLGCPIVSAMACAFSKSSGKPVAIGKIKSSADGSTTEVSYEIV
jgi:hypothetical protein